METKIITRVIVALDNMSLKEAATVTKSVGKEAAGVKVGFELLCDQGAAIIMATLPKDIPVFFDPKLHDIPNTAAQAAKKLARRGAWIINVHCSGGRKMMEAVRTAIDEVWEQEGKALGLKIKPLVIGVTALTSLGVDDAKDIGIIPRGFFTERAKMGLDEEAAGKERIQEWAINLALLAKDSGLDGVVTSPQEAFFIRAACGPNFQIITPGIRLESGTTDDQVRIATPAGAILAGADWLVVGRPVTQSADPVATLKLINQQVAETLALKH